MESRYPRKLPRWVLPALTAAAAAVYIGYVAETNRDNAFTMPLIDGAAYHARAAGAVSGTLVDKKPYWQPPLYAWWLTAAYRVLGPEPARVRYAQVLFMVLTVVFVFLGGRRVGGDWVGLASASAVIVSGPLLFYFGQFLPAGIAALTDAFAIWLLLRAVELDRARDWLFCGLAMGIAALAVPNILAVTAVVFCAKVLWRCKGSRSAATAKALSLAAGVIVCILPVTVRNALVSGQFVPISTNAGVNLFIGNNARSEESMALRPGLDWDRLVREPFLAGARTDAEAQRRFAGRVMDHAVSHPAVLIRGFARKARLLCTGIEMPRNLDIYVLAARSRVLRLLVWRWGWFGFPFGLLAPLSLAGIVIGWRSRETRLVALCALVYAGSIVLFFPSGRYRAPMLPLLALLAGRAVVGVVAAARERRVGRETAGAAAVLCCGVLACALPVSLPTDGVNFGAELENALGAGMEVRGDRVGAMERYRAAIGINPDCVEAHLNLANALRLENRIEEALEHYRKAIILRPDHDGALTNMGIALAQAGQLDAAIASLSVSLKHNPWNAEALLGLGACYVRAGDVEMGVLYLEDLLRLEPGNVSALQNLAGALCLLGKHSEAVVRCREALAISPHSAGVHNTLGMALLALGRAAEARAHIERAAQLNARYRKSADLLEENGK